VSGPGTGSTLGFSTIKGRRVPFEGRPASPDHRAVDDPPTTGEDSITDSKALKLILRRFRAEWALGREPSIDDYLTETGNHGIALLAGLVRADLECRLEAGRAFPIEVYLARFPELGDKAVVDLIIRDFTLRRRRGMTTTVDDYLARFPRLKPELLRRFSPITPPVRSPEPDRDRDSSTIRPACLTSGAADGSGAFLPGKFEVVDKIGAGGMGEVWRVRRPDLGIERAVKRLLPGRSYNRETIARMLREAQAMARLNHPHAVVVHDVCVGDNPYIEMELIRGRTLDQVLHQHKGSLTTEWTAKILDQLCSVLQAAHKISIVHRDLKPSNLMLVDDDGSGEVNLKVLDFGISKFLDANPEEFHTQDGQTLGTLMYMSPEQVCSSKDVDARSDIYSVGVILYELLTGCLPFTSRYPMIYQDILNTPAPPFQARNPNAQVPPAIEKLVLRCLEKEPDRRPSTVKALAAEFQLLANPEKPKADRPGLGPGPDPVPDRRRVLIALASIAGLGGLGLYGLLRPTSFTVITAPRDLDLNAGKPELISVLVAPDYLAPKVQVRCEAAGLPTGVVVRPEAATEDGQHRFRIESDPNLIPQSNLVRHAVKFWASDGRTERTSSVELIIHPPKVADLPDQWVRLREGTKLEEIDGKFYPFAIERTFPDGESVIAFLITKQRKGQPDPFYIMRDKVWQGLFNQFAPDPKRREGSDPLLPMLDVTGVQAQEFAKWLGGVGRGFLPTCEQWDQAAGKHSHENRQGPFLPGPWDPKQIAVNLPAPLPIGQASRDISPYGCRDMSGNGWEWTRLPPNADTNALVETRAERYEALSPFLFENLKKKYRDHLPFDQSDPQIGFRVVIELEPMN